MTPIYHTPIAKESSFLSSFFKLFTGILTLILCTGIVTAQGIPIKADRNISLQVSEGTRMDLDISPDGERIVFSLLGDLYAVPISGGKAVQVTRGLSFDRKPAWSPDGKYLAYISDSSGEEHCWVMDADGTNARQIDHGQQVETINRPAWSPDGNFILIKNILYFLGGGELPMPEGGGRNFQYSPDGQYLYYYSQDRGKVGDSVKRYDRHTKQVITLSPPGGIFRNPVVSPDGHWMAYVTGITDSVPQCSLRVFNLQTGKDKLLAFGIDQFRTVAERYNFTPDSRDVVIGYGGKLHKIDINTGKNDTIHFEAKMNVACGAFDYHTYRVNEDSIAVRYIRNANRSPDRRHLVFDALNRIYIMALPDGTPKLLTNQTDAQFQPVYSPDGRWIAYVTWNDSTGGHLWKIPSDGGKPMQLTLVAARYDHPAWSSDGKYIVAVRVGLEKMRHFSSFSGEMLIVAADGGETRVLLAGESDPRNYPAFSSDGSKIWITRPGNATQLFSVSVKEGKQDKTPLVSCLLDNDGASCSAAQILPSPDGRYLALVNSEDIYLCPAVAFPETTTIGNEDDKNITNAPLIRLTRNGGIDPRWEEGGKRLTWSYANIFYCVDPDKAVNFAIQAKNNPDLKNRTVPPDEQIAIHLSTPGLYGHGTIALRGGRLLTMHGGESIENGTIVITNGRIVRVGRSSDISIPADAKIMDMRGKTIMPGLIDLHAHGVTNLFFTQQVPTHLSYLAFGVTTTRDPSTDLEEFGIAELIKAGIMVGPRLYPSGVALIDPISSLEEAKGIVNKRAALGGVIIKQYRQLTRLQRQWVLEASKEAGMNMTNEGDEDFAKELSMAIDGSTGSEHQYDFPGNIYNDVKGFYAAAGTWLTPTLQHNFESQNDLVGTQPGESYFYYHYKTYDDPKLNYFMGKEYVKTFRNLAAIFGDTLKKKEHPYLLEEATLMASLRNAGARVTLGSHGNCIGIGAHYEMWGLKMGGLTNLQALQAATILGAEGLGMQQDLGSIESGKIADFLILDKNPLENIENTLSIRYVMKGGVLYSGQTLDEVWPEYKKLPNWKY